MLPSVPGPCSVFAPLGPGSSPPALTSELSPGLLPPSLWSLVSPPEVDGGPGSGVVRALWLPHLK